MNNVARFFVAMSSVIFVGCSSNNRGGTLGTGGHSGVSQGNGGATVRSGSSGGSGGSVGTGGTIGSVGTVASGGTPGSGGKTELGGSTSNGGNTASGGSPTGGAIGRGGAGGAGSDVAASHDANMVIDLPACPFCPAMKCTYGSPVDGNGCTVCTCNPAPDGGIDVPNGSICALPEGCPDAGSDTGTPGEAGGRSEVNRVDASVIKCGSAVCGTGQYCCNPVMNDCAPTGSACAI
jgi:hypothetical protein